MPAATACAKAANRFRRPPTSWSKGFKAEAWYWGLAVALGAFAATFSLKIFAAVLAASLGLLWVSSLLLRKRSHAEPEGRS